MSNEILGPLEFCRKVRAQAVRWILNKNDHQFAHIIQRLCTRLRIITVKEVYAALGEGFPEGGTCHIGWISERGSSTILEPCVYVVGGGCYAFARGKWYRVPYPIRSDIGDEPARSFVNLLGNEFAAKLAELEAGQ